MEKVVKNDSKDFEVWTELGTVQFQREEYKDAAKSYEKSLEANPDYLLALINLGKVRIVEKKYQESVEPLDRALKLEPNRAETNRLLGEAYLFTNKERYLSNPRGMTMGIGVSCVYCCSHHLHHGNVGFFKIMSIFSKFSLLIGYQCGHFIKVACQFPQLILRVDP